MEHTDLRDRQHPWPLRVTLGLAGIALRWEMAGLDLPLARWMGGAQGFGLRHDWWLQTVLHDRARQAAWALGVLLCLCVAWPLGPLRQLPLVRRAQLALAPLLATLMVAALKSASHASCPWDLAAFGGVAHYQSHWLGWWQGDGGGGRCFPAGHASAGFAFAAGWFALRRDLPALAWRWLLLAGAAGLALGMAQQWRGAHFMSHTLWTAWLCWVVGWAADSLLARLVPATLAAPAGALGAGR